MRYAFDVKEISYGQIDVEAESYDRAREIADKQYSMGNTVWQGGEYEIEPREEKDRGDER